MRAVAAVPRVLLLRRRRRRRRRNGAAARAGRGHATRLVAVRFRRWRGRRRALIRVVSGHCVVLPGFYLSLSGEGYCKNWW